MQFLSIAWFVLAAALAVLALGRIRILPWGAMRLFVTFCTAAAAALIVFAWWGQYTAAGHRAFDEMDALYPFAAGALGLLLTVIAALAGWLATRRRASRT